jgi:ADP-ribose pyrophosphatase YjhB (NUDIX family)
MKRNIDVTVAAIIESGEKLLFVEEEASGRIVFNQPAGHLEPGESLADAVIRETFEETGFAFIPEALLGIYLWHCEEADTTFLRVAFCGRGTPPINQPRLDDGIIATHWMSRSQIIAQESRLRSPLVLRCVDDYQANIRHPLSVLSELPMEELALLAGS